MMDSHAIRIREARAAAIEAERRRQEVHAQWPEIRSLAESLRQRRKRNNFAAMIAAAMRGTT